MRQPTASEYALSSQFHNLRNVEMIFDIGCDRMMWSTPFLREAFPDAVIHGFEADPKNANFILENESDRRFRVEFHSIAVCESSGICPFWPSHGPDGDEWPWSGSTNHPSAFNESGGPFFYTSDPVVVPCVTVDDFCLDRNITKIDLLCMDVQGAEIRILRGAQRMLPAIRYIFAEHNSGGHTRDEPGLDGLKNSLPGWQVMELWPYDVLFRNPNL